MAELQLHGGRAVVAAALRTLGSLDGLRPAEAGEFTRRAFENGKLDLTAVEGLADLVAAETEAQRRQAYRQLKGLLGDCAEAWRARLIEAMALVEARIDFSDEADVPEDLAGPALKIAQGLRNEIAAVLAGSGRGERLREGLVVAITGPPNVGKSTLLNRIAQREVAIVSPFAGTTRDVIEVHLDLDGYPVTLLDTAGMRESENPVEQEGVRRARDRASQADLVVWVEDARDRATQEHSSRLRGIGGGARSKADLGPAGNGESIAPAGEASAAEAQWVVWNKADLLDTKNKSEALNHRYHFIASAVEALQRALLSPNEDIIAEDLRSAARALGKLTGRVDVEDVLDRIFGQFCIGK
jgi:tRNA modification GTPase